MCALVLFHVVFSGEGFVAGRAEDIFLACMLLAMTGCMAGCGERVGTGEPGGMRAGIFLFCDGGFAGG